MARQSPADDHFMHIITIEEIGVNVWMHYYINLLHPRANTNESICVCLWCIYCVLVPRSPLMAVITNIHTQTHTHIPVEPKASKRAISLNNDWCRTSLLATQPFLWKPQCCAFVSHCVTFIPYVSQFCTRECSVHFMFSHTLATTFFLFHSNHICTYCRVCEWKEENLGFCCVNNVSVYYKAIHIFAAALQHTQYLQSYSGFF